ncbi:phage holin [Lactobacillus kefiranofaciens]|uniref:phage holin n=1 Tax=Lactobacillus kefiranofaciens TaxID=267818 RepID=UPI002468D8D8|nr:phage holin [Lactobacillus kefiranofaciens]MDH5099738.1 phage holin [Lactobacillus kefiranofaciens]
MTIKDWIYLGITVASYLLAIIAGIYAKDKAKINRATRAGQALDVLGKLATNADHEAEYIGGSGQEKREFASEIITQGLAWLGVKGVTPNLVNGAIEKAYNSMNIANQNVKAAEPEIAQNVPEKDILQPQEQAPQVASKATVTQSVAPQAVAKDVTVNGN